MFDFLKSKNIYILGISISFLLSFIAFIQEIPINLDALLYLHASIVYTQLGWKAAFNTYSWPLLSILIGSISQIFHCSVTYAAYLINALLQAFLVYVFIKIIEECYPHDQRIVFIGALVILLHPYLNAIRAFIIRDFGYWAFSLWALWAFLRYLKTAKYRYAIAWVTSMLIATFFRIEGIIFLLFAPIALLFVGESKKLKKLYILYLFLLALACIGCIFYPNVYQWMHDSRLHELDYYSIMSRLKLMGSNIVKQAYMLKQILSPASDFNHWANQVILLLNFLSVYFLFMILRSLNIVYAFLAFYSVKNQWIIEKKVRIALYTFMSLNLILLCGFILNNFFISERYIYVLTLLCLLWVPPSVNYFYLRWKESRYKSFFFPSLVVILLILAIGGIIRFGYSQAYIIQAGHWAQHHIPIQENVYSNDKRFLYYAQRDFWDTALSVENIFQNEAWKNYLYLAIHLPCSMDVQMKKDIQQTLKTLPLTVIQVFQNKRHDQIIILVNNLMLQDKATRESF